MTTLTMQELSDLVEMASLSIRTRRDREFLERIVNKVNIAIESQDEDVEKIVASMPVQNGAGK